MKNIRRGILFCVVAFSTSLTYGGQEPSGVAEINVAVKQKSGKPAVTDAQGNFILDALPAGSYTLFVWARSAKDLQPTTRNVMVVATSYSIKVEGAKRSAKQSNLTSDALIAGVDIPIEVGPGAKIRGRVLAEGLKRFVWVPKTSDTNLPAHWAEEGASDAVPSHNIGVIRRSDLQNPNR
jgi:hypothetical protein